MTDRNGECNLICLPPFYVVSVFPLALSDAIRRHSWLLDFFIAERPAIEAARDMLPSGYEKALPGRPAPRAAPRRVGIRNYGFGRMIPLSGRRENPGDSFMNRIAAIFALCAFSTAAGAEPFSMDLSRQGLTFHITSPNDSSVGKLRIAVDGLAAPAPPIEREIDGVVVGAEVADLDANGFPELYVFTQSAGSGSYGNVVGYASNRNKSLTDIFLPELGGRDAEGYQGHDSFAISGKTLLRRFPIYRPGDPNAGPRGGERRLHYRLRPGEAGWVLTKTGTAATSRRR